MRTKRRLYSVGYIDGELIDVVMIKVVTYTCTRGGLHVWVWSRRYSLHKV